MGEGRREREDAGLFSLLAIPKELCFYYSRYLIIGHSKLFPDPSQGQDIIINALCASGDSTEGV